MHELALAKSIAAIAEAHGRGGRVEKVEVKVGHLRQVSPSALAFGFELVVKGTDLEGAELAIEQVPVRIACRACGDETALVDLPLTCPACGSAKVDIAGGDELLVEAVELAGSPERV
ncbi:MAG TPA: hydrogenase maturation nickel metallochaperone HypA [Gaiellaceae bacterium]